MVIHTIELRTDHYQLSRLLFLLRSIAILGLNSRSMQGQGMQKFSIFLFLNMAVAIFEVMKQLSEGILPSDVFQCA